MGYPNSRNIPAWERDTQTLEEISKSSPREQARVHNKLSSALSERRLSRQSIKFKVRQKWVVI